MRIIVPIKQVPETRSVRMDEVSGTVIRDGVESIVNPLDLYAIELALRLRQCYGGTTVAVSMGPAKAATALREALAMGIDDAILLTDRAFAGSDTWATAYVLAEAIRQSGPFDLIICGERATDGDTGQVGPEIAAYLDLPVVSYVNWVDTADSGGRQLQLSRMVETGSEMLSVTLPAVLTVVKQVSNPRLPTLRGKQRARQAPINSLALAELGLDPAKVGLRGSPTRVVNIFRPRIKRDCRMLSAADNCAATAAVAELATFLPGRQLQA